ncbi:PHP C-terminal domain protein [Luminiphilus syltensis NOR5-1B]|uniref:PHP C-terminal domain protein n=1 Tax=Luminiphilus syltensis NOR5-1B TaxID=565045 RepID=B8KQK1_9GAMM|nr:PHP domain-containing protein [Luminiphilus syltensis]EED36790.1 PHP C-terminal domain protein [Luminiphilus syltensis NOR5-1B]
MHSTASDGALRPRELLARLREAGVERFALTDHDTIAGFSELRDAGVGDELVTGVELSCAWSGVTVHVVGLGFVADAPPMRTMLERLGNARMGRAEKIAERLAKRGMPGGLEAAMQIAGSAQIGRPHFARWMVSEGYVEDTRTAFNKYLGSGKLGDVKAFWPRLGEVVAAIVESNGIAVLAHPLKYSLTRTKLQMLCRHFRESGGRAIEVINGRQTQDETSRLRKLAEAEGFLVSVGSDFHRDWAYGPELGVDSDFVKGLDPVWGGTLIS